MACLPHQNLVSGQTVNQTESAFVSVKLSPFNLLFFFNPSTIKKIFILEKWLHIEYSEEPIYFRCFYTYRWYKAQKLGMCKSFNKRKFCLNKEREDYYKKTKITSHHR